MIGIVILNYINWNDTKLCIESIFENEKKLKYHIYVVDNNSPVKCPIDLSLILNDVSITLLKASKNRGYSAGNNIGINKAINDGCQEILLTNNDVLFKDNSIYELYKFLRGNELVGIVGPKIYLTNGKIQMINMGIKTGLKEKYMYLLRKTIFYPFVKTFINKFCALEQDLSKPFEVHSVSGCCFMMSENCAKEITPLDENTFLYQEELIIGFKMEEVGYKTMYVPNSEVIHAHGQTTSQIKAFSYTCLVESELYYFKRYLKSTAVTLFPLYIIRTTKYLGMSIKYKDFRTNLMDYFKGTIQKLLQKY